MKSFSYELDFPEMTEDDKGSFVPRLWAGRKVDYLLAEIRKTEQPEKELVDEVTYLAKRYGIVTPYTSYLMTDDIASKGSIGGWPSTFNRGLGAGGFCQRPLDFAKPNVVDQCQERQADWVAGRFGGSGAPLTDAAKREAQVRSSRVTGEVLAIALRRKRCCRRPV